MWQLYENKEGEPSPLKPLVFSNGKNQENVVQEVLNEIKKGHRVIFIHGVCGTGKSAIALNLAKEVGKTSIVVPIKNLQNQYEEDYSNKKYLLKNGKKLKIQVITGRANHQCPYLKESGIKFETNSQLSDFKEEDARSYTKNNSCDNYFLPCKIEIKEKNLHKIKEYLKKNPKVDISDFMNASLSRIRRMSIAPICPYWSPIVPSEIDLNLEDAKKISYKGLKNIHYTIYQRKPGCNYYNQFNSYIDADVLIFNSQKYKLETLMNRKPATDLEIIDECDEFLDSFSNEEKINLNRLNFALGGIFSEKEGIREIISELEYLTQNLLKDKKIQESITRGEIYHIKDTKILDLIKKFLDSELMNFVECDEENYCYSVDEIARNFKGFFDETYVSFYREERDLVVRLVTTNLEKKFKGLLEKNKILVLMSGTIHSEKVLENIFGISDYRIIEAETEMPGKITKLRTGLEIDCKYSNFKNGKITREQYLKALDKCIKQAQKPVLIHVNAFKDLPTEEEKNQYDLDTMSREKLRNLQSKDSGESIKEFKGNKIEIFYTTRCNRGVDFPGQTCNSIILTRYPNPDINSLFWRILKKTKPVYYFEFYKDKALRELLQKIYRGLRSKEDHVFLLSPDSRVFSNHYHTSLIHSFS